MTNFSGKSVLITGGAMGLGKLVAKACIKEGASRIVIWDINEQAMAETAAELKSDSAEVHTFKVDVSDVSQINDNGKKVLAEIGTIDILFNNAGIVAGNKWFHEHGESDIQKTIDINVSALMHVTRIFLPAMLNQGGGHIVNLASAAGLTPNPRMSVYASSKWAVVGWSESLRLEMDMQQSGVHVTTVCPGYISTGMFDGVKNPLLTPILKPADVVRNMISAVKGNRILLRMPFMVKALPLLRGILPVRAFDFLAGSVFGVYKTMDSFKGRQSS